jgi:hypothetical protein
MFKFLRRLELPHAVKQEFYNPELLKNADVWKFRLAESFIGFRGSGDPKVCKYFSHLKRRLLIACFKGTVHDDGFG